jgi:type IV secretory pathway VirJ component
VPIAAERTVTARAGWRFVVFGAALLAFFQVTEAAEANPATAPLTFPYGRFGETTIYRPAAKPTGVTLFISGDGGWNLGVVDMARHLVDLGSVVIGIDIRHYRDQVNRGGAACQDFSGDFENLSHAVQQRLGLDEYWLPVLVGYSSGATLAYAVAVQSPKGTYGGVLSLGFCPDLDLKQPICRGAGLQYEFDRAQRSEARPSDPAAVKGVIFQPAESNTTPWFALQGDVDQVCAPAATRNFVAQTGAATLVPLPKVGHGYSVERNWLPQFVVSYRRVANPATPAPSLADTADLPLVEVPARAVADPKLSDVFAVLLTGDGGWAGLDQDVASELAGRGVP